MLLAVIKGFCLRARPQNVPFLPVGKIVKIIRHTTALSHKQIRNFKWKVGLALWDFFFMHRMQASYLVKDKLNR